MIVTTLSHANTAQSNKRVTLRFKKEQLLHEIADYGYIEGDVMAAELADAKRTTQDIVQKNNASRIVRILDLAFERVVAFLSPLTDTAVGEDTSRDNVPTHRENYDVVLSVASDFTQQRIDRLEVMISNYMVWYALYHWLSITNDKAAAKWRLQAEELEQEIRASRFPSKIYRRPFRPF